MSRGALAGLRVAVTRTPEQASALMETLEREGAQVASFPLIRIEPVMPAAVLGRTLRRDWDWVVFTSANALRVCAAALEAMDATPVGAVDVADAAPAGAPTSAPHAAPESLPASPSRTTLGAVLRSARIAVVGPATAAAARAQGLTVSAMPDTFIGDEIVAAMGGENGVRGRRVLWPRAEAARDVVTQTLRGAGATLDAPIVYRSVPDETGAAQLARRILQQDVDVVTFTSPSCVRSLVAALPVLRGVKVAAIGPVTAEAARAAGYPVDVVAEEFTTDGIVQALVRTFGPSRGGER